MNRQDIDQLFTKNVAEYLAKGYTIYTSTMRGSQGEVAKIDLKKGNSNIRVLLDEDYSYVMPMMSVIVGIYHGVLDYSTETTIWNSGLDVIEMHSYAHVGNGYYVHEEHYDEILEKKKERQALKYRPLSQKLDERASKIALPFVKRQPKKSRAKLDEISVSKQIADGRAYYIVSARGERYMLR